jgi:hypothetical protein
MKIEARPWSPQDLLDDLQGIIDEEPDNYLNTRRTTLETALAYLKEYFAKDVNVPDKNVGKWIPVTERLPDNEVDVLILAQRRLYRIAELDRKTVSIVATAFHTDGKMNTEDSGYTWELDNVDMEYDEEADAFIVPEGWWEAVRYGEEFSAVDDFVTHWMHLPEPPKEVEL